MKASITEKDINNLNRSINKYVKVFCKKHELYFDYWVADLSGGIGVFGDYYIGFDDIRLDLETHQPEDEIFKWYDIALERGMKGESVMNYYSWIKGYR